MTFEYVKRIILNNFACYRRSILIFTKKIFAKKNYYYIEFFLYICIYAQDCMNNLHK